MLERQQIAAKVLGILRQRIGDRRALIRRERAARESRIHVGPQIGVDRVGILMIASRLADQRQLRHGAALGAQCPPGNHRDHHQGRHQQAVDQQQAGAHGPRGQPQGVENLRHPVTQNGTDRHLMAKRSPDLRTRGQSGRTWCTSREIQRLMSVRQNRFVTAVDILPDRGRRFSISRDLPSGSAEPCGAAILTGAPNATRSARRRSTRQRRGKPAAQRA